VTALEFVAPITTHRFSALLYGSEGSRKSTAAVSAPDPNLYLNADRKDGIRFARSIYPDKDIREVRVTGLSTLHETVFYVREHPEVETVTLDTVGRIFDLVLRDTAKDDKHATLPEIGNAQTEIERFIELLIDEDVNVVLVAHDMTVETSGSEGDGTLMREQMPMTGTSKPSFSRKLMRLVSVVAFCGVIGDGEQRRGVAQLFEAGGRRAKDGTGALAGTEGVRPTDLTEWVEAINAFYAAASAADDNAPGEGEEDK
jgi:hypothetical protein